MWRFRLPTRPELPKSPGNGNAVHFPVALPLPLNRVEFSLGMLYLYR
jgi:hypothetical protein